jgi:hypothetical protein
MCCVSKHPSTIWFNCIDGLVVFIPPYAAAAAAAATAFVVCYVSTKQTTNKLSCAQWYVSELIGILLCLMENKAQ